MPDARALLALEPEEFAGILLEIVPHVAQRAGFVLGSFTQDTPPYEENYPPAARDEIQVAVAEAISWMETQGIIVRNPGQPVDWYLLTRRGRRLSSRADLDAYRRAHTLPRDLLQPHLAEKVFHLFARGDHDTAVFQAFKEVEIAVRRVGGFPDSLVGRDLMHQAFSAGNGPLAAKALIPAERESEMFLFSGAIGHAKNPSGHRNVNLSREEAARLIVFASHLLDIVAKRMI